MFLVLSGSFIMFAIAGIQYWATNYFIQALNAPQKTAFIYFGLVSITAPITGAIISAFVTNRLGGFTSEKTLPFGLVVAALVSVTAVFIVLEDHFGTCIMLFWAVLCNGALLLPIVVGVMLTKVEPEMRATANSFANFMYNLLGFFPSPFIYGLAIELSGQPKTSHWGIAVIMVGCCIFTLFLFLAMLTDKSKNYFRVFQELRIPKTGVK